MSKLTDFKSDELLIALLEGELDPEMEKDLERLLKRSEADRKTFHDYQAVREIVEICETRPPAMSAAGEEKYFADLHSRIMEQIPASSSQAKLGPGLRGKKRAVLFSSFLGGVALMSLALAVWLGHRTTVEADKNSDFGAHVVASTQPSDMVQSILDRDFMVQVAEQKLNNLNDAQAHELLKRLTL